MRERHKRASSPWQWWLDVLLQPLVAPWRQTRFGAFCMPWVWAWCVRGSLILAWLVTSGDSHTVALAASGAVWAWGTYRDASGVYGFSPTERIALLPALVHEPATAADRIVKIASGALQK